LKNNLLSSKNMIKTFPTACFASQERRSVNLGQAAPLALVY
jgi:hypothetical protein